MTPAGYFRLENTRSLRYPLQVRPISYSRQLDPYYLERYVRFCLGRIIIQDDILTHQN
jgi:hypothetical protein